eukprot:1929979-Prymnesium_polylepis.1
MDHTDARALTVPAAMRALSSEMAMAMTVSCTVRSTLCFFLRIAEGGSCEGASKSAWPGSVS